MRVGNRGAVFGDRVAQYRVTGAVAAYPGRLLWSVSWVRGRHYTCVATRTCGVCERARLDTEEVDECESVWVMRGDKTRKRAHLVEPP